MSSVLRISEAASLALHAMVILAGQPERRWSAAELARLLKASPFHLSKVLQRLTHVGLVNSRRGPGGGFSLARPPHQVSLLEIYEAVEGPFVSHECLLGRPVCGFRACIFGGLVGQVNRRVRSYLRNKKLSHLRAASGVTE